LVEDYDLSGKPELRVEAREANVRIETWDQNKIEARVTHGWHIGSGGLEIVGTSAGTCGRHRVAAAASRPFLNRKPPD
jgi:hypothetical protein